MCEKRFIERVNQETFTLMHSLQESSIMAKMDHNFRVRLYLSSSVGARP